MMRPAVIILAVVAVLAITGTGCKRQLQNKLEDTMLKAMTEGSWTVTKFTEDSTDLTSNFTAWICKFHENGSMTATKGTTAYTGSWTSDFQNQRFTAEFPPYVGDPVRKVNGTWTISGATATVGKFNQTRYGVVYYMELTKY